MATKPQAGKHALSETTPASSDYNIVTPVKIANGHLFFYRKNSDNTFDALNRFKGTTKEIRGSSHYPNSLIVLEVRAYLPYGPKNPPHIDSSHAYLLDKDKKEIAVIEAIGLQTAPYGRDYQTLKFELRTVQTTGNIFENTAYAYIDLLLKDKDSGKLISIKNPALPVK